MKRSPFHPIIQKSVVAMLMFVTAALTGLTINARGQGNQLSLADILIALRSKKVTLADRNKILTEAIATRGTTFTLTPEIEKELADTGAGKPLLDSIRQRPQIAKVTPARPTMVETKPKAEPVKSELVVQAPVQDVAFFQKRAEDSVAKGDLDAALIDYTKAVEMDGSSVPALIGRGRTYIAKRSYMLAITDFAKVIGLEPKNAAAFALRAEANEDQGNAALALDDYKKAFELDPTIETAKAAVERFNAEQARLAKKPDPPPEPAPVAPALPEFIDLGAITETQATKMVRPAYTQNAVRAGAAGKVVVEIEIDASGNVTKAKTVSGHPFLRTTCEEAALKSKFKPAVVGTTAVKAKARIVYEFLPTSR